MGTRTYDITLSCGCAISRDGGGGLMPCSYEENPDCKYFEEYLCNPKWVEWELEIMQRNYCEIPPTKKEVAEYKAHLEKRYKKRMKEVEEKQNE